ATTEFYVSDFNVSLVVPLYNQEEYVVESLQSVLQQQCPPTEILIADDNSTDRTFEEASACVDRYSGHHEVKIWKNKTNLGSGNIVKCAEVSTSKYMIQFHGDDIAKPNRASRIHEVFAETGASLISTNATVINKSGAELGPLVHGLNSGFVDIADIVNGWHRSRTGATQAFDVGLIEKFTPWTKESYWAAIDTVMPFRAALLSGSYYLDEDLLLRREHDTNFAKEVAPPVNSTSQQREIALSYQIVTRAFLQRDLTFFEETHGKSEKLHKARKLVDDRINSLLDEWSRQRTLLFNNGFRPQWTSREALFQSFDPIVANIGPHPRAKSTLFRVFTRLAKMFDDT
ncbi:MAG: glycosyltransferase family 2 protein, partial [Boseongicola sp.]